jgi:hypothetical protein
LAAIRDALDRAGVGAKQAVEVGADHSSGVPRPSGLAAGPARLGSAGTHRSG